MEDGIKAEGQDLVESLAGSLRSPTPEVRLIGDGDFVREMYFGPKAREMFAALPKFTPVLPSQGMYQ